MCQRSIAAKDSEGHLSALQSLVELLSDPDFFAQLEKAQSPKDNECYPTAN